MVVGMDLKDGWFDQPDTTEIVAESGGGEVSTPSPPYVQGENTRWVADWVRLPARCPWSAG